MYSNYKPLLFTVKLTVSALTCTHRNIFLSELLNVLMELKIDERILFRKAWFPYGRNGRKNRVTIFLNGQFIIVYTCKPHKS